MGLEITTSNPIFYLILPPEKASKYRKIGESKNRKIGKLGDPSEKGYSDFSSGASLPCLRAST